MVVQRNPFLAALSLILHLASLAALYLVLQGDFVAVAQLLVYAGAVMIMFLFVIAYLGDRADLDLRRGGLGAGRRGHRRPRDLHRERDRRERLQRRCSSSPASVADSFGSPATIGRLFLTDHLLAFEAISLILLVGAIAGVVLGAGELLPARPRDEPARARAEAASATTCGASCRRREEEAAARERGGHVSPGIGSWIMLSSALFCIGLVGVMLRRNPLVILLSLEIMLNAGNLLLVAGSRYVGGNDGHVLALTVMAVAAAEVVVGLGLIVALARRGAPLDVDELRSLHG